MTRMLIMGPPGAGKGTQAAIIAERLGVPAISTGDIFRANERDRTELGQMAQRFMDAGEYVPDDVTNAMVRDRLAQPDARRGFLLDGYPRTVGQVEFLDGVLAEQGTALDRVLVLTVDSEELVGRLTLRARESGRTDDTEDVIRRRQQVYARETAPLLETYAARDLLAAVDGIGEVEQVTGRVLEALGELAR